MRRHTPLGDALCLVVGFLTLVGMWMIIVLAAWGIWHTANALAAHPPEPITAHGGRAKPCNAVPCLRKAVAWQKHEVRHLRRQVRLHYADQVELGYQLGQAFFGVDLHALGYCESTNNPLNTTGPYAGITQQGPGFYGRPENARIYRYIRQVPAAPYARPVFVAIANILVAARWISLHGSSEWQCRLDGSVKHGGAYG